MQLTREIIKISSGKRVIYRTLTKGLPELFCLHGGMGLSADSLFSGLLDLSDSFDLVFIDQRGCGDSDVAPDGSYRLEDFASDLMEIVPQISVKNQLMGLFGHSLGGMIAIKALGLYPKTFHFSILSNTAMDDQWRAASKNSSATLNDREISSTMDKLAKSPTNDQYMRELAIEYGPLYFPELQVDEAKATMKKFTYRAANWNFMSEHVYPGMNLRGDLSKQSCQTLVVAGEIDPVVPVYCQRSIVEALGNKGQMTTIMGAGHFPFITRRTKFNESIQSWWNKVKKEIV